MSDKKNQMKEALQQHFEELLARINKRFEESAGQLQGIFQWSQKNFKGVDDKFQELRTHYLVTHLKTSALVEILVGKGLISQEEYEQKTEELAGRRNKAQKKQG